MRGRESGLGSQLEQFEAKEKTLRSEAGQLSAELAEIERASEAAAEQERRLQQLAAASDSARSKAEREQRARVLADVIERQTKLAGEIASIKVTAKHLQELDAIEREMALLDARLESSAAQLSVSIRPGSGVPVSVGDQAVKDSQTVPVTAPVTISVGDIASISVTPPAELTEEHGKARAAHLARQAKLLRACNAANPQEAREGFARKGALEAQLRGVMAQLGALGIDLKAPEKALTSLRKEIAQAEAEIAEALQRAGVDALPDAASLEAQCKALARQQGELRRQRRGLEVPSRENSQLLGQTVSVKAGISGELGELRRALAADLASLPDEKREAQLADAARHAQEAEKAHQQAAGALKDLQSKSPQPEELERLRNKVVRLEQAITNQKRRLAELDKTISNLEGQIQSAGGDGVGEQVAALQEQLAQAEGEVARYQIRVEVLKLLANTIGEVLGESRERFYTPIMRHLKPYLSDLFPGAELTLGDGFAVAGLKRTPDDAERFDRLSDGTREQIAVIVRLAMGALLAEQGREVPIILDDALVFSDDDRISRMFDALIRAGKKQQVIVLTCRTRAFAGLGGRPLSIAYERAMAAE